ncbi:MAG: hypothetical protein ACE5WD_02350 [Candidatus Aminicenantia bacterium]
MSGQVLASRRIPYASLLESENWDAEIKKLMENQHQAIINEVKEGKFDHYLSFSQEKNESTTLYETTEEELARKIEINLVKFSPPALSSPFFNISLETKTVEQGNPLPYVDIVVKIITALGKNYSIFKGKTDDQGNLTMSLIIPKFKEEKFAMSIKAEKLGFSPQEIKKYLRKK